jgi:hypothetical protein
MPKHILAIFSVAICLLACRQNSKIRYYWVSFRGHEYWKSDTLNIILVNNTTSGDTSRWSYSTTRGYTTYYIINKKDTSLIASNIIDSLLHPNDTIQYMRRINDSSIQSKKVLTVERFILDEDVQDGAAILYYAPQFGIFASHSGTWPGIRYLQTNDTVINGQIKELIKATVPKYFRKEIFE